MSANADVDTLQELHRYAAALAARAGVDAPAAPSMDDTFEVGGKRYLVSSYEADETTASGMLDRGFRASADEILSNVQSSFEDFRSWVTADFRSNPDNAGKPIPLGDAELRRHHEALQNVSRDEVAAIRLYTDNFANDANAIMRQDWDNVVASSDQLHRYEQSIKMVMSGLNKMPRFDGQTYRDVTVDSGQLETFLAPYRRALRTGGTKQELQFQSSTSEGGDSRFQSPPGQSTKHQIQMIFESSRGRDIRSVNPQEMEIIMPPGNYRVSRIDGPPPGGSGVVRIYLTDPDR